jgi:hypothetical protein
MRDWQAAIEVAAGHASTRIGREASQRLSMEVQIDTPIALGWRAVVANRLDVNWLGRFNQRNDINTLKELHVTWQPRDDLVGDAGRVNVRNGVASGYNPTDYFRQGATRSVSSVDPASLKKNRQGSAMLRGQTLWEGGSATAMYSPRLATRPSSRPFDLNWGGTNNQDRWLLALSQKLTDTITPQWLLYKEERLPAQIGMNVTSLVTDATVGYLEWSGGRSPSLLSQMQRANDHTSFRNRISTGFTYTTTGRLSMTLEFQYNGVGLDSTSWEALQAGPLSAYGAYRQWVQFNQDMPTRKAAFFYASLQDFLIHRLDLAAMARLNLDDRSRLVWLELRHRGAKHELALQLQGQSGSSTSEYGVLSQRRALQLSLRHFF